jgi:hypothetical protein
MRDDQNQGTLELLSHQLEQKGPAKLFQFPAHARTELASTRRLPRRPPNSEVRSREYFTSDEVEGLMQAAGYMSFGLKTVRQRPTLCEAPSCGR